MAYNGYNSTSNYSQVPYHEQPDSRLPPPGIYPEARISFQDSSGFDTHMLILLAPASEKMAKLLRVAREKRGANPHTPAYDIVSRAAFPPAGIEASLKHISDGPRGGIWVLAKGKEEVVACLVDELEEFRVQRVGQGKGKVRDLGGWEVIGQGVGVWRGSVFLIHPCGDGAPAIVEKEAWTRAKTGPRPAVRGRGNKWIGDIRRTFDL